MLTAELEPVPASLREALVEAREGLRAALTHDPAGGALLHRYSERIIDLITPGAAQAVGRAGSQFGKLAIVVVGGLARGEHCPHSDVDLTVVCTEPGHEGDEAFGAWIRELCHPLWDAGLRLRTTVHRPETWIAAAAEDLPLCTALLDMRFIAGDRELVDNLTEDAHRRFFGSQRAVFLQRLTDEMEARQRRYGTTVYTVEPDLKFGPGGTRDVAIFEWALMARRNLPEPWDAATVVRAVRASGVPHRVARLLAAARDSILRLRAGLHLIAGRTQDRLNFQYQEGMPALLGLLAPDAQPSDRELVAAIEACMQDYYRSARDVQRYGARVFARCQPPQVRADLDVRIDERFHVVDDHLRHFGKDPFADSPVLGLEALTIARDHNIGLSGPTLDAIVEAAVAIPEGDLRLANEPEAQRMFLDLLVDPSDVGSPTPLELCHEVGLLERIIPEFAASRGRMQHEGFHVYTVDQHSLYAVEFLKAIARGDHRKDFTMATAVHLGIDDPRPLYLSTLLHDAGKPFGDQMAEGARIVRLAAARAELGDELVERCAFLVGEHQTMPMLSQKRDLTDALLIREFAEKVGDRRTLDELYLVSLADMANVSPEYLTSWKLTLLDELYLRTAAEFANRGRRETIARRPRPDEPEGLPPRYYSLFDQELRREHRALLDRLRGSSETIIVDAAEGAGAMRLTVVTADRRGLLASLTAGMAELGLEVVAADIFSVPFEPKIALDVFRVVPRDPAAFQRSHDADWAAQVQRHLRECLAQAPSGEALREPLPPLAGRVGGRQRRTSTKIRFSEDPAGCRTIVDVETIENPGVAARISRSFAALDLDIEIARINTEMRRVDAVFYVSKLDDEQRAELGKVIRANLRTRRR
jgi:[protein-PII] uridylyltransferase